MKCVQFCSGAQKAVSQRPMKENCKEGVGYHCWHLPGEVELREGCGHKEVTHWCLLRVQFWEVVGQGSLTVKGSEEKDDERREAVDLGYVYKTCGSERL